ncbi:gastrula zinc finger protein XlCGF57.1-like [Folsomia candida]|uniref:gastrula zinc finger protein XlCGF57.1-like n=1 Tax=Folsomia candida TaxID=158441 RepID=UPI001604B23D|nr:gastrula zinc finger protein XlCGF57.1-like [Folsomia candida]
MEEINRIRKWECSKRFKTNAHLRRHVVVHDLDGQIKCEICGKTLTTLSLPGHLSNVHGNQENLPCDICHKEFRSLPYLRQHIKTAHCATPRLRIPCRFEACGKSFMTKASLRTHFKTEHEANSVRFACPICGKKFKLQGALTQHLGTHTTEKPFKCGTCGRSFVTMSVLRLHHQAIHLDNSARIRFTCPECPWTFLSKSGIHCHTKYYHSTLKQYSCPSCQFKTQYKINMSTHFKRMHDPASRRLFECYFCGRKLISRAGLDRHINTHTTEREQVRCTFPGFGSTFSSKYSVNGHWKMEHAENPVRFGCTLCTKEFKNRGNLNKHIATHTKEKTNKCATCGWSFLDISALVRHRWTHQQDSTGQPVFPCQECPRTYLDKNSLTFHVKSYHSSAATIHSCKFCDYTTNYKSHLNRHMKRKNNFKG